MIDFNRPPVLGTEVEFFRKALASGRLCGDGPFTRYASDWMKERFSVRHCYLTTSCTSALEMASWLCDLEPGDEVIMPSYTFVSTADAFVLRGARIVFVQTPMHEMALRDMKNPVEMMGYYDSVSHQRGIPLLDYGRFSFSNDTSYFLNAQHLNRRGAEVFTDSLAHDLKSLGLVN